MVSDQGEEAGGRARGHGSARSFQTATEDPVQLGFVLSQAVCLGQVRPWRRRITNKAVSVRSVGRRLPCTLRGWRVGVTQGGRGQGAVSGKGQKGGDRLRGCRRASSL